MYLFDKLESFLKCFFTHSAFILCLVLFNVGVDITNIFAADQFELMKTEINSLILVCCDFKD